MPFQPGETLHEKRKRLTHWTIEMHTEAIGFATGMRERMQQWLNGHNLMGARVVEIEVTKLGDVVCTHQVQKFQETLDPDDADKLVFNDEGPVLAGFKIRRHDLKWAPPFTELPADWSPETDL